MKVGVILLAGTAIAADIFAMSRVFTVIFWREHVSTNVSLSSLLALIVDVFNFMNSIESNDVVAYITRILETLFLGDVGRIWEEPGLFGFWRWWRWRAIYLGFIFWEVPALFFSHFFFQSLHLPLDYPFRRRTWDVLRNSVFQSLDDSFLGVSDMNCRVACRRFRFK